MASGSGVGRLPRPEMKDAPALFKSGVWDHFGFPVTYDDTGNKNVDRTVTICKHCKTRIAYASGNTSNMTGHLRRHHPSVSVKGRRGEPAKKPFTISAAFKQPLAEDTAKAKSISKAIGIFIAKDMQPYSVVEGEGFRNMIKVLEPRYVMPSRRYFGTNVIPNLYEETRVDIVKELSEACQIALTTDGWTSRSTESYLTVTAHYITPQWELRSCVLQTRPIYESHTSEFLSEKLREVVEEWKLERDNGTIPVTTDNAKNIVNAVGLTEGLGPQISCFAHTVNLAAKSAISTAQISRLLAKVRKVVTFFHRSTTAAFILKTKQDMLTLPDHKLIHDVPTRWNSTYDMLERYVEQQAALYSAVTDKNMKKKAKDISLLTDSETKLTEGLIDVLKPLKNVTTLMSTETSPSVSMIMPLQRMVLKAMAPSADDSSTIKDAKAAITKDLQSRYSDHSIQDYLHRATALDPRFKSLPYLDEACVQKIWDDLTLEIVNLEEQAQQHCEAQAASSYSAAESEPSETSPPPKKSAMATVFADFFTTEARSTKPLPETIREEVTSYKKTSCISVDEDPLVWWKTNAHKYPHVAKLAQRDLAVPGTSVPSERVFSTAGDIVTASRSRLLPENVDKLIFMQKNMRIK
ncbi:E3 SUMO-protein ligase ZBED1-like [Astyanax mexicanus]|uniref:E3 SUMO-protein ligase ZBED1-like n=1 Tax=Astyanax mexicanus TaxID=7994 RepID=UPI0020CAEC0A|nr:E3 SUMO-protein ligase ZBED1-like [Astyanax mexicanus]